MNCITEFMEIRRSLLKKWQAYIEALVDEILKIMIAFDQGNCDPHDENGVPKIFERRLK